jgi:hypothetical protein
MTILLSPMQPWRAFTQISTRPTTGGASGLKNLNTIRAGLWNLIPNYLRDILREAICFGVRQRTMLSERLPRNLENRYACTRMWTAPTINWD